MQEEPPLDSSLLDNNQKIENPPGFSFWPKFRKCPSPAMMGKDSKKKEKRKVRQKTLQNRVQIEVIEKSDVEEEDSNQEKRLLPTNIIPYKYHLAQKKR